MIQSVKENKILFKYSTTSVYKYVFVYRSMRKNMHTLFINVHLHLLKHRDMRKIKLTQAYYERIHLNDPIFFLFFLI